VKKKTNQTEIFLETEGEGEEEKQSSGS